MTCCETLLVYYRYPSIHHFHGDNNAPRLPPEILYNLCFQFFLGTCIRVVPREIKANGYVKLLGVNKVHYGVSENGPLFKP